MSENAKNLKKIKNKGLAVAAALSVGLVAGIPMIVLGATNGITAVMVIGIVLVVLGFYGAPVAWTQYASKAGYSSTLAAIEEEDIDTIEAIAQHLGKRDKAVRASVDWLISHGCLKGYTVDKDGNIKDSVKKPRTRGFVDVGKCPNCNAPLEWTADAVVCPYCGMTVKRRDSEDKK